MKKNITSALYLVMAAMAFLFVQSCTKEKVGTPIFYANIQQYRSGADSKVHIDYVQYGSEYNNVIIPYSCWNVGDKIQFYTGEGTIGLDPNSGRYYIDFPNLNSFWPDGGPANCGVFYPRGLWTSGNASENPDYVDGATLFLEPVQKYEETEPNSNIQRINAPMGAFYPGPVNVSYTENDDNNPTIQFYNLCALLEVTVNTGTPIKVTRIEVENTGVGTGSRHTGRPLWGDFKIQNDQNNIPVLFEAPAQTDPASKYITKEITLECEEHFQGGKSVSSSHPFYVYIPPVGYDHVRVTVYARDANGIEYYKSLQGNRDGTFEASNIYKLSVTFDGTWKEISQEHDLGPYTVNGSGKKVEFDFANLHHDRTGYFIPPYQYDFVGYHDPFDDYDVFVCTKTMGQDDISYVITTTDRASASPSTLLSYNPGINPTFQGPTGIDPENGWYLLSPDEWIYILHGRDNTTNPYRFFSVIVASVPGVLLIPDNDMFDAAQNPPAHYTAAWNIITSLLSPNTFNGTFRSNVISLDNFYVLEKAGCAFLPCVFHNQDAITSTEDIGYYWTSQVSGYGGGVEMNLNQESSGVKSNLSPYYNPGVIRLARDFGTR